MSKLDAYLRSIERFGAVGAILTSNQPVTLRFPTGDRHATQVTPHDQLVGLVREIAPPAALDQVDQHRPVRFDYESGGARYALAIVPRPGTWQVSIEPAAPPAPAPAVTFTPTRAATGPIAVASELEIERGQYDDVPVEGAVTGGSFVLDELTRAARAARATDLVLAAGAAPMHRIDGQLVAAAGPTLAADALSRELGVVAPGEARAAWTEHGAAVFAYGDGAGRIRVTLGRDHRGPTASLRLLPAGPPQIELPGPLEDWLLRPGLVVIAGAPGTGKTVTLAAVIASIAARRRRVIAIEDPIEVVHDGGLVSQREVGAHVASVAAGVAAALREAPDAIAVGAVAGADAAAAVVDAAAAGGHVVTTIAAASPALAVERLVAFTGDRADRVRALLGAALLGTIVVKANRSVEVVPAAPRR